MRWTLPNVITVSRVPMMFAVVGLMIADFNPAATLAFWLFIVAALSDWLDGLIARKSGQVSQFGRFMDAVIDKVMVLGLMVALLQGGYFGELTLIALMAWLCILTREFAISGLRMIAAVKGLVVEADKSGKVKTFTQLNAIGWLMGARMLSDDFGDLFPGDDMMIIRVVHIVGLCFYFLSALLTVTSGWNYLRRHAHVFAD
ncbi:CDP-diacylglycerol--glycerol-3-phosphate 3-phosphatidyltransferase [Actomonas aquatica]|uniref:CDP-diacylglycerol--glycerol-3-phosphate 3-phosphatidyltransferase n=1 Tax=Actomonas aquatica TaxID=2866162 RepID=A0ABZ1CBC9_9BACT|nr:CDP-diacylglycerol--glycerol-3-phosphate 3-phosphatidyltransferase [Opitutus sp. WL0086]WRQ88994.1 CDP-diacylglycerol--glycerol-3-phosphate 3-phosphatidyltransferase [Opitutus sp. WL0086]